MAGAAAAAVIVNLLLNYFVPQAKIILFLREHKRWIVSQYKQSILIGNFQSFKKFINNGENEVNSEDRFINGILPKIKIRNIQFKEMNILKETPAETYDLIVSNPPYIPLLELEELDQNIKEFESNIALTDQSDGLIFYQRIVSIAPKILRPNGHLVLEVGKGEHPKKVYNLFSSDIFGHPKLIKDYNGDDRVLIVQSF